MYSLLRTFLPSWLANGAMVLWYTGLIVLLVYFSQHDQAPFRYAEF
ncbi:MAG TPA: hypothetical protein VFM24_00105 [Nitrospira sp.]|nr:hypothetical protein [Nitrospira sp.]